MRALIVSCMALVLAGCGDSGSLPSTAPVITPGPVAPPTASPGAKTTHWPLLLSHAWSRTAGTAFQGDQKQPGAEYNLYGIKTVLEADGVTVFQPDKLAYASHERRGQLLYKKCAGRTIDEILCQGENPQVVDGVHKATLDYCAAPAQRARHGFADEAACQQGLQFNIICHSQGCADSRYMLAAVENEFSGKLMYHHVASWTSLAGANKGTAQADVVLEALAACLTDGCRSAVLDAGFGVDSFSKNQALILEGSESVVALTRKYMLHTTDMNCDPATTTCKPSFNMLYPLPEDPTHPILYQTFSGRIENINHPCYAANDRLYWEIVMSREGDNDGNISVNSQMMTTYGPGESGPRSPVIARFITGESRSPSQPHPGLNHMAYNDSDVPGIEGVSCAGEDNSMFRFSRVALYRQLVAELAAAGY